MMAFRNKVDVLNAQSSILAKKVQEIEKKHVSSDIVEETKKDDESSAEETKTVIINNDGNFMENFLKMEKEKKSIDTDKSSKLGKIKSQNRSGPLVKKSRYSSMFQQMKKIKQPVGTPANCPATYATATCFHGEDSSSEEEETQTSVPKPSRSSTKLGSASFQSKQKSKPVVPAAVISPVLPNAVVSSIKSVSQPTSSSTNRPKVLAKERTKPRKNRWGEKIDLSEIAPPGLANMPGVANVTPVASMIQQQPVNLGLPQNYRPVGLVGVTELSNDQKKQLQEQKEMQAMYSLIMANRNATKAAAAPPSAKLKPKYEYDSDEEIDDKTGTWEHQKRRVEMEKTQALAEKLTGEAQGKHFIGDFLPPAELEKFMETFRALKEGRTPDYSDYKEFKIQCDNIGFKMLEKMGWSEGEGLGNDSQGIKLPVNQGNKSLDGRGLGLEKPDNLSRDDDDFSAYRKRMMLAYKFRPNPLNNPRRPYY